MSAAVHGWPADIELHCGPVSAAELALYAAASGDLNPLHLDAEVARAAGFDRPVVHGMLTMAYAGRLLTSRFGPATLRSLSTRFLGVARLGDTLVLRATLARAEGDTAHYRLQGQTTDGTPIVTGSAQVALAGLRT